MQTDDDYNPGSNPLSGIDTAPVATDPNGNTTTLRKLALGYTADNRLAGVAGIAEYRYNGLGQRVRKTLHGQSAHGYLYGPEERLLAEFDGTGGVTDEYLYLGTRPIAVLKHGDPSATL